MTLFRYNSQMSLEEIDQTFDTVVSQTITVHTVML